MKREMVASYFSLLYKTTKNTKISLVEEQKKKKATVWALALSLSSLIWRTIALTLTALIVLTVAENIRSYI